MTLANVVIGSFRNYRFINLHPLRIEVNKAMTSHMEVDPAGSLNVPLETSLQLTGNLSAMYGKAVFQLAIV